MKLYQLMRIYNAEKSTAPLAIFDDGKVTNYPSRETIKGLTKKDGCDLANRAVKSFSFEYGSFHVDLAPGTTDMATRLKQFDAMKEAICGDS